MSTNPNDPIQSVTMKQVGENDYRPSKPNEKTDYQHQSTGLTKREYFAAKALTLLTLMAENGFAHEEIAGKAVSIADALIAELNKENLTT